MSARRTSSQAGSGAPEAGSLRQTDEEAALFEFQHAAICYIEAFSRHIERQLISVTGNTGLSAQDCMILHAIRTGTHPKSITEVQHFLNRSDVANVQYSVKKLIKAGLLERAPRDAGRGTSYRMTHEGERVSGAYMDNRRRLIADLLQGEKTLRQDARTATRLMITLTGLFDHLSRADRA